VNQSPNATCRKQPIFLISTLAEYQTHFWLAIGKDLQHRGYECAYLSFDDRSTQRLRSRGFQVFSLPPNNPVIDVSDAAIAETMKKYGIDDLNYWFSHERMVFGIRDHRHLRRKLMATLRLADEACSSLFIAGKTPIMIQEIGGFLSVVGTYFAAIKNRVDHWFIEPAFFRGRLFFQRNSFSAPDIPPRLANTVSEEMDGYLKETIENSMIVVPQKDKHHYSSALRKILNRHNLHRLAGKMIGKYVMGNRYEFGYIQRHISIHLRMVLNSILLRKQYKTLDNIGRFIYYPLHVPADMALTLRSPQFLDQVALIDYLARTVPHPYKIVIKEHPAMIGAIHARRLCELLDRQDNLYLAAPSTNNYQILRAAEIVLSINSKAGAEAVLLGKPVLVLGDAFYTNAPFVQRVHCITDIPNILKDILHSGFKPNSIGEVNRYFETVWQHSSTGELYVTSPENILNVTDSLIAATEIRNFRTPDSI